MLIYIGQRWTEVKKNFSLIIPTPFVIPAKAGIHGINSSRNPEQKILIMNLQEGDY